MSAAERPSMPSRCRWPRTKVDFDARVIKARAIGRVEKSGKGEKLASDLSPGLSAGRVRRQEEELGGDAAKLP
jgi:hypothetical protein